MSSPVKRKIFTVLALIIAFTIFKLLYTTLLSSIARKKNRYQLSIHGYSVDDIFSNEQEIINETSVNAQDALKEVEMDDSGKYKIVKYFIRSRETTVDNGLEDITLVTMGTMNHLYELQNISSHWNGPISVTFFSSDGEISLPFLAMMNLKLCNSAIDNSVTFHLIFPSEVSPHLDLSNFTSDTHQESFCSEANIKELKNKIRKEYGSKNYAHKYIFPVNLARNTGWSCISTSFVFSIDIDFLPNSNLYENFIKFSRTSSEFAKYDRDMYVFIVLAFEKEFLLPNPRNKEDLLNGLEENNIRRFNLGICDPCHNVSNYKTWEGLLQLDDEFGIAFEVDYVYRYEPYFIARKEIPKYDERFVQFGSNRLSLVCELHVVGYKFAVLNDAFVVHNGFKKQLTLHHLWREEMEANRMRFKDFRNDLKKKYPESNRTCVEE